MPLGELLLGRRVGDWGLRSRDILANRRKRMLELRCWHFPTKRAFRLLRELRARDVLPVDGPRCNDGLPVRELLCRRRQHKWHMLFGMVLGLLCERVFELPVGHLPIDRKLTLLLTVLRGILLLDEWPLRNVAMSSW